LLKSVSEIIKVGASERTFRIYVPPALKGKKNLPLVLAFHGGNAEANGRISPGQTMELKSGFSILAEQKSFIVIYPDAINGHWYDGRAKTRFGDASGIDDVGFISALIDHAIKNYGVNPKRVFATGGSNGGIFIYRLAAELPDKLAAVAPVAAAILLDIR
jgi:polyhydroxybutyrate depolymerase